MLNLYEYIKRNFCYECEKDCNKCDVGKIREEVVKRTYEGELLKEIKDDLEIVEFDCVSSTAVYTGFFDDLKKAKLKWRKADKEMCDALGMDVWVLKLSEIREQLKDKMIITIFINDPLSGVILQYGNYGDSWWQIGKLGGYA